MKEDLIAAKEFAKSLSNYENITLEYKPVAVGKYYHDLMNAIFKSDIVIFFWSTNSLKSIAFSNIANKVIDIEKPCLSFFNEVTEENFPEKNFIFKYIPEFSHENKLTDQIEIADQSNLRQLKNFFEEISSGKAVMAYCTNVSSYKTDGHFEETEFVKLRRVIEKSISEDNIKRLLEDRLKRLLTERSFKSLRTMSKTDVVNFAIFAPRQITKGSRFAMDIWAYLEDQYDTVLKKAEEIKRQKLIGRQDSVAIKRESVLTIRLELDTLNAKTQFSHIYWGGKPASTTFLFEIPKNAKIGDHYGTAKIYNQGICLANIIFSVNVSDSITDSIYQERTERINKYKSAFASYSSKDGSEVYSRVHGMTKIAPDLKFFLSRLSLKSKEMWEEALIEHVPTKDVFFLFWSRNAKQSAWVENEWRLALKERDLSYIDPVPLESPKLAAPPPELSALHFDDIWVALKHENDYIDTYPG
jgi:hypothetical protein